MLPGKRCASPAGTKVERCCLVPKISRSAADRRTYNRPARKAFPRRPLYGFVEVAQAVRQAAEALGSAQASTLITPEATSTAGSSQPAPRSSNLRFKKEFTDRERHRFLTEAFEYVARYFENSPNELHGRNTDVETDFRRIDANRFEAIAFVGGREQSRCGIWLGGLSRTDGISFSYDGVGSGNSYNESMSVRDDGYTLYLGPMGMAHFGQRQESELTHEEAAEYFWRLLVVETQVVHHMASEQTKRRSAARAVHLLSAGACAVLRFFSRAIGLLAASAQTSPANDELNSSIRGGELNYRTGKLDDGTDPVGWYERD